MAVTTVVLIRGEGDVNAAWSWGNKFSGHIRQSLPKHSATTFRVPEINKTRFIKIEKNGEDNYADVKTTIKCCTKATLSRLLFNRH